jgi:hypothetical protein
MGLFSCRVWFGRRQVDKQAPQKKAFSCGEDKNQKKMPVD